MSDSWSPFITGAVDLLEGLTSFFDRIDYPFKPKQLAELSTSLGRAIPFGRPTFMNVSTVSNLVQGFPASDVPSLTQRRPAWKPILYKGKQRIEFILQERIECVLYDKPKIPNRWRISGALLCKAEIEGIPEVNVTITNRLPHIPIHHFTVNSCVQNAIPSDMSRDGKFTEKKLTFIPPNDQFELCRYEVREISDIPIRGFYQMAESSPTEIKFLVQLKLNNKFNNNFAYCHLQIPFPNRGQIKACEGIPTCGTATVIVDRSCVIWDVGTKFNSRNLEVTFSATVYFEENPAVPAGLNLERRPSSLSTSSPTSSGNLNLNSQVETETLGVFEETSDPFLVGNNSFVQMRFSILGDTMSGLAIEGNQTFVSGKIQSSVEREILADNYVIWNDGGEVRSSAE
eukprot:TRINITY_DN2557_c0_g1_i2.p1 TRINITY_DN2557_c0_g1~~TRINITY_DN2557_c0_g1_i2.p1  ORF type:complete len:400 (-),score=113.13 TRINITY_DN2557_c0_g1_i2:40-1239(-)